MLWAMDGNDSLKRILRRMVNPETGERDGPSRESTDSRAVPGDIYISREAVNRWAKEITDEAKKMATGVSWFGGPTQCFADWPDVGWRGLQPMC